jgi:SnoaL-like domain
LSGCRAAYGAARRACDAHEKRPREILSGPCLEENVEIVRSALAASDRTLDDVAEYWDPDIDWRAIEGAPDDIGVFKGHEAMRRYYGQWYETFDDLAVQCEELITAACRLLPPCVCRAG